MKKINKKSTLLVVGLSAIALSSVGFAGWLIQSLTSTTVGNIGFQVEDTLDKSISLTKLDTPAPDLSVTFDADKTDNEGDITYTGTSTEDLEFGFSFTIDTPTGNVKDVLKEISVTFEASENVMSAFTKNYLVAPISTSQALSISTFEAGTYFNEGGSTENFKEKYVITGDTSSLTVAATFSFKWGSYFGGVNPSRCDSVFNPNPYNGHTLSDIKGALQDLGTLMKDSSLASLTLTPKAL